MTSDRRFVDHYDGDLESFVVEDTAGEYGGARGPVCRCSTFAQVDLVANALNAWVVDDTGKGDPMTSARDYLADVRSLGGARSLARRLLPRAIRDAHSSGATTGQLALASGLSRQRIHQIVKEEER